MKMKASDYFDTDTVLEHYLACALWSSVDCDETGGEFFDENYDIDDLSEEALESSRQDVNKFINAIPAAAARYWDSEDLGHDLWLTRNGHGAGFWDRAPTNTLHDAVGEKLTTIAQEFGGVDLYAGDDGKLYV